MGRKQNPAYADLLRPNETDWRSLGDSGERRRIQNRLAQRAYRLNAKCHRLQLERLKKQLEGIQQGEGTEKQPEVDAVSNSPNNSSTEFSHSDRSSTPLLPPLLSTSSSPLGGPSDSSFGRPSPAEAPAIADSPDFSANLLYLDMDMEASLEFDHFSGKEVSGGIIDTPRGEDSLGMEKHAGGLKWIPYGSSLLHIAAEHGHREVLRLLLAHGKIDINGRNVNGHTPLQLGVLTGRVDIVQLLLDYGADITL